MVTVASAPHSFPLSSSCFFFGNETLLFTDIQTSHHRARLQERKEDWGKLTVLQRQIGMLQQTSLLRIHHGGFVRRDAEKGASNKAMSSSRKWPPRTGI